MLVPGLQAVKESGVHLRIHRLANLATVLATLQKERVPQLEKIVADEVLSWHQDHCVLRITSSSPQVEAGHPGSTLALLWAMVRSKQPVGVKRLHCIILL